MPIARVAIGFPHFPLDNLYDYGIPPSLLNSVKLGSFVEVEFGHRITRGIVFGLSPSSETPVEKLKFVSSLLLADPIFEKDSLSFMSWLSKNYFFPLGEVCEGAIPSAIRDASPKLLDLTKYKHGEAILPPQMNPPDQNFKLKEDQQKALDGILENGSGVTLLFGVTGSGKTEVYLHTIAEKLKAGFSAMVLVPEISLTPQLTERFENRFPGEVATFHSGLKKTQIRKEWMNVYCQQKRIALGPRSALFAPVRNLGCIIVDEEHDSSYKQEERLRYNARDAALFLAKLKKIPVILGSATPSAESLFYAKQGKYKLFELASRATAHSVLPEIEIFDLKKQIAVQNKNPEIVSSPSQEGGLVPDSFFLGPLLCTQIEQTLAQKNQAILFINRRGLGSQFLCKSCGWIAECPSCSVKLTPHKSQLLCHYCGYNCPNPVRCQNCKSENNPFVELGIGTEGIEVALAARFPGARIARLDRDSITNAQEMGVALEKFKNHETDILVGTQMVAKGHDFPKVTLVGILFADLGLGVPDFRVNEKSFQLLLQVAGRAGRGSEKGRVVLQCFQTDHPVFQAIKSYRSLVNYTDFIEAENEKRQFLFYPPYGKLIMLKFEGADRTGVTEAADLVCGEIKRALKNSPSQGAFVLGPAPSPLEKIRNKFRWQVLIKSKNDLPVDPIIHWALGAWHSKKLERRFGTRLIVDVDPIQML